MKMVHQVPGSLRQLFFPKEFRIPSSPWDQELEAALRRLIGAIDQGRSVEQEGIEAEADSGRGREVSGPNVRFLAELGTGLWRLRQRMIEPETDRPPEGMRRAYRHLESVLDMMTEAGVKIQDHTDDPFDAGLSLRVIAFQTMPGIQRERVVETIKPTVYLGGQVIQMGEVIVASPEVG